MCLKVTSWCAGVVALFANKWFFSTVNHHVSFQLRSFDACVAALVATLGLLSMMLNRVHFEVFLCFEGEIALNTRFGFDHFHRWILGSFCSIKLGRELGGELKMAETKFKVEWFLKSESNIIALSYLQLHGWKWWWWLSLFPILDHNHNIQAIAWFTTKTSKYQYRDHLVGY